MLNIYLLNIGSPVKKPNGTLKDVGVISIHELREIRNKTVKGEKPDAAIISNEDLMNIKSRCIIHSPDKLLEMKKTKESKMETMMSMAKTRKEKMKLAD